MNTIHHYSILCKNGFDNSSKITFNHHLFTNNYHRLTNDNDLLGF